ncbi:MAG: hypothetical protein AB7V36_06305 [Bacteroidales bacterium]
MVFATGTGTTITRYYQSGFEEDEYSDGRNKKTYYISTPVPTINVGIRTSETSSEMD